MKDKGNEKRFAGIRKKLDACDDVIYLVGNDLFRENATKDVRWLVQEVENCWKEIENLNESVRILTSKMK